MKIRIKPIYAALLAAGLAPSVASAVTAPVVADSYTNAAAAAQAVPFGGALTLKIIGTSGTPAAAKSLLRFNLAALPAGATAADVTKATLFVWVNTVNTPGALQVSDVTTSWSESSVTYTTSPTLGTIIASNVTAPASTVGYYVAVDVTNSVKNWIDSTGANFGLAVEADTASPTTSVLIDSKESTGTSHPAYIDIATASGVTSVGATAPISNTGTTSAPVLAIAKANGSTNGYLSAADWTTFNSKGAGTVTQVTGSGPISVATGATTPAISIAQANGTTSGYLSATDWNTFNNKGSGGGSVSLVSASSPLSVVNGTTLPAISISQASSGSDGYLSAADWIIFNSKGFGSVTSVAATAPLTNTGTATDPVIALSGSWSDAQVDNNLTLNGGTVNNSVIGGTTPAAGSFTGLNANSLALGASTPAASAILDLVSTTLGLLPPRMTTAQRTAIASPANALIVYDTDLKALQIYDAVGAAWTGLGGSGGGISSVSAGTGLNGGGSSGTVTLNLANTAVTSGSYTNANITVDAQGRLTAAASGSGGGVTSVTAAAPLASSGGATPQISLSGAVAVANGGTGATSLAAGEFLVGNGTGAVTTTSSGASLTNLNASNIASGTVALANGGTGASTAPAARTNLGLGSLATLNAVGSTEITDGSVSGTDIAASTVTAANIANTTITAGKINSSGGTSGQVLKADGAGNASWAADNTGVGGVTAVTAALPLASSGGATPQISLSGTVPVGNGGTGATTLTGYVKGSGTSALSAAAAIPSTDVSGLGSLATLSAVGSAQITDGSITGSDINNTTTITASAFSGSGASLTNLNAGNLASGTVPTARLGSGTASNTTFLRGDGTWSTPAGGGAATGASPRGVPYGTGGHNAATVWHSPTSSTSLTTVQPGTTVLAATACTPSMTITSYAGTAQTWSIYPILPSTSSATWTPGLAIISCSTTTTAGSSCSATAGSTVAAGTIMSLSNAAQAASGGGGFISAFSCD